MHLSLPKDINEEQMLDVIAAIKQPAGLSENQAVNLELDAITLVAEVGGASRVEYCRTIARLVNSGLFLLFLIFVLASCKWREPSPGGPTPKAIPDDLPSITAIQQRLNELEPENPIKVDGKLGPATAQKWDRIFIEQSARKAWRDFEGKTSP